MTTTVPGIVDEDLAREVLATVKEDPGVIDRADVSPCRQARLYCGLTTYAIQNRDLESAKHYAERAQELAYQSGNPSTIGQARFNYGQLIAHVDPDAALAAYDECVELGQRGAIAVGYGAALFQSALVYANRGELDEARSRLRASLELTSMRGRRPELDGAFGYAIELFTLFGDPEAALVLIGAVLGGVLQHMRDQTLPPDRTPPDVRGLRDTVGRERFDACIAGGKDLSYEELIAWTLQNLT